MAWCAVSEKHIEQDCINVLVNFMFHLSLLNDCTKGEKL